MRRPIFILSGVLLTTLSGCAVQEAVESVPAPWRATEPQSAEPAMRAPDLGGPQWQRIGSSVRGKAIEAVTVGGGPRRVYVVGGMQGDEPEGPRAAGELPALLAALTTDLGATVRIVRDMNPDGTSAKTRGNTRGVDLSRNWPSRDFQRDPARAGSRAKSELETTVVFKDMEAFKPDIVVVLHASARGPEVTFEGPALQTARSFTSAARQQEPRFRLVPETRYRTPGSLESLVGRDWNRPVIVVDLRRGTEADRNARAIRDGVLAAAATPPPQPSKAPAAAVPAARRTGAGPAIGSGAARPAR